MFNWIVFNLILFSLVIILGKRGANLLWLISCILLGFRYKIGPDFLQYEFVYDRILSGNTFFIDSIEPFHLFLVNSSGTIGGSSQLVLFIYALLTCYFFYKGFKYYSRKSTILFSVITCFYFAIMFFSTTNIVRQALAASIILYSSRYLFEKKTWLFLIIILLSSLIHISALFLSPLILLQIIKLNNSLKIFLIIFISAFIFINPLVYIVQFIPFFNADYLVYLDYGRFSENSSIYTKIITMLSLVTLIMLSRVKDKKLRDFFFNVIVLMFLFRVLSFHLSVLARMDFYLKPFFIILLSLFFVDVALKIKKQLILLPFILSFAILSLQEYIISEKESAFRQYSMNLALFGDEKKIIQIFGNHNDVKKWDK